MPAKHGITTNQSEYLSYTMVKPFDLLKQHGTINIKFYNGALEIEMLPIGECKML